MQTPCIFYAPEVLWAFPWHPELTAVAAAGHKLVAEGILCHWTELFPLPRERGAAFASSWLAAAPGVIPSLSAGDWLMW